MTLPRNTSGFACLLAAILWIATGCGGGTESDDSTADGSASAGTHTHADGTTHADHDHDDAGGAADEGSRDGDHDHAHEEVPLETITIAGMEIELAQGHGAVEAGKESHLVVKLPYSDQGETIVRAWLGTEDRTASYVGKGEYAASHDDYDIHATAPDPLPDGVKWWIEIVKPDATKHVGSAKPILDS